MKNSCENCKYVFESMDGEHCKNCIHNATDNFEPMTNADHIRSMDDTEMAEFLCDVSSRGDNKYESCIAADKCVYMHNGMIDWLRSPVEVENE